MSHEIADLIKAVAWPAAVIFGSIALLIIVRSGGVSSISATKDGVIVGMTPVDRRENSRHAMDRRIQAVDDALALAARRAAKSMRRPMVYAIAETTMCSLTKRSIGSALLDPFFDAADENDFRSHLSANARAPYLNEKMDMIRERYAELADETATGCKADDGDNDLPAWKEVEPRIREVVERWAAQIAAAVERACIDKIAIYRECRPQFEEARDKYFIGVVDHCIAKNEGYIAALNAQGAAA